MLRVTMLSLTLALLGTSSCCAPWRCCCSVQSAEPNSNPVFAERAAVAPLYTCSMHSDVTSDKPGQCPECGMDLIRTGQ